MKEVFLYDVKVGDVFHCLFTGMDCAGHAVWLNISRDCSPESVYNYYIDADNVRVLSSDGKPVPSKYIAKVLSLKLSSYNKKHNEIIERAIIDMKEIGLEWTKDAIVLDFRIAVEKDGTYTLVIKCPGFYYHVINNPDGYDSLDDVFDCISAFLSNMEMNAKIPVSKKIIQIDNKLKGEIDDWLLSEFDKIIYKDF